MKQISQHDTHNDLYHRIRMAAYLSIKTKYEFTYRNVIWDKTDIFVQFKNQYEKYQ